VLGRVDAVWAPPPGDRHGGPDYMFTEPGQVREWGFALPARQELPGVYFPEGQDGRSERPSPRRLPRSRPDGTLAALAKRSTTFDPAVLDTVK
jgi:hypothetical protein